MRSLLDFALPCRPSMKQTGMPCGDWETTRSRFSRIGAPRLYSRGPSGVFGETRRSMSSFAKASEDTRCAFLHGLTAVASCVGG
jgi:hypothetical protein